jgi:hypothetical protein
MDSPYHHILEKYNQFNAPGLNVELEIRVIIPHLTILELGDIVWEELSIPYYRSTQYPSLTIRRVGNKIETKELIEKVNISNNISVFLSIEKEYKNFPDSIFQYLTRDIKRTTIHNKPYTTITYFNNTYLLEIEYNNNETLCEAMKIISNFSIPYWPTKKPIDAYTTEIISKLISKNYYITTKADGEHCLMYIYDELDWVIIFDNGNIMHTNKYTQKLSNTILEGEWMDTKEFLCFDILQYRGKDLKNLNLVDRVNYVRKNLDYIKLKKHIHISNYNDLICGYNKLISQNKYKTDGWILTPKKYGENIYKSKQIPTVDLQYIDGYLYLANERVSTREPKYSTYSLENGKIYEFTMDMELIKIREDKIIPNYKMPVEIDPITSMVSGKGLPFLRYHHNFVKLFILDLLKQKGVKTLLDVGSGYGGDINKWIKLKFEKVYAVDPYLNLRSTSKIITHLRCELQSIPNIEYEGITLFFVPWTYEFLPYLINAKYVALIIMSNPKQLDTPIAKININNDQVSISFPDTITAQNITEQIPNINTINNYMDLNNFEHFTPEYPILWGSDIEKAIVSMYTYHLYIKIL